MEELFRALSQNASQWLNQLARQLLLLNIRGLLNIPKQAPPLDYANIHGIDIIDLTESWLSEETDNVACSLVVLFEILSHQKTESMLAFFVMKRKSSLLSADHLDVFSDSDSTCFIFDTSYCVLLVIAVFFYPRYKALVMFPRISYLISLTMQSNGNKSSVDMCHVTSVFNGRS